MIDDENRPQYKRPEIESNFSLDIHKPTYNEICKVEFWIISTKDSNNMELLYSYNNIFHKKDRASYIKIENSNIYFRHREGDLYSWDNDGRLDNDIILCGIRDYVNKALEEEILDG